MTAQATKFDRLVDTVGRLHQLIEVQAKIARLQPDRREREVESIAFHPSTPGYGREPSPKAMEMARSLKENTRAVARLGGIMDGQAELRRIALELESLRVTLPTLAAEACIEIGVAARAMAQEELK